MAEEQKNEQKKLRMLTEEEHKKALVEVLIDIGISGGVTSGPTLAPRAVITITGGDFNKVHALALSLTRQALDFDFGSADHG